jgi:predicted DNA-binding transcriptional regulator AlpA
MPVSYAAGNTGDARLPVEPELIDADTFGQVLNISTRHLRRLVDAGKAPQPFRLGRACGWSRRVVETWIADGCPNCRKRPGVAR